jgi:hypothetical protein
MFAMTTTDWIALGSASGTGLAAVGTVIAVVYAAKSANASRDSAETMRAQWQRDRDDRAMDEWRKKVSLLSSLRDECKVIDFTFRAGSRSRLAMPEWEKARAEIGLIDSDLASSMRELEMRINRHNEVNEMNARVIWEPRRDKLLAETANIKRDEEIPVVQAKFAELNKMLVEDGKKGYEPTMPLLKSVIETLDAIYTTTTEHPPPRTRLRP